MTDLEITKLCAKAMKIKLQEGLTANPSWDGKTWIEWVETEHGEDYWPLKNDAQAMALMIEFRLLVELNPSILGRRVRVGGSEIGSEIEAHIPPKWNNYAANLRHAICECVAQMEKAQGRTGEDK